jgi:hypothetical protein
MRENNSTVSKPGKIISELPASISIACHLVPSFGILPLLFRQKWFKVSVRETFIENK